MYIIGTEQQFQFLLQRKPQIQDLDGININLQLEVKIVGVLMMSKSLETKRLH